MVKATWLGHACWLLEGSATVLIDPFLDDNPAAPRKAADIERADVVVITHDHFDHIADAGSILQRTGGTAVSTYEVANALADAHNVNVEGMNIGGSVTVGPVTCHMTQAFHTADQGAATGFVIEMDGVRVYHTGDTCVFGDMALIGELLKPDLLLCPIGDRFTMGPRSAARAVKLVNPRVAIPMPPKRPGWRSRSSSRAGATRSRPPEAGAEEPARMAPEQPGQTGATPPPHPDWYDPRRLYERGYPQQLTSALQVLPALRRRLEDIVRTLAPEFVLEIGPGNRPVARGPGVTYLDVSGALLRQLAGARVEGSLLAAPFLDDMFDLAIACDVLTHIPAERRPVAMRELCRLAPQLLLFNPEPGGGAVSPPMPSEDLAALCRESGLDADLWPVTAPGPQGLFHFGIILARRR
jgi:L-ascorbate metabolism protein UlaG (beta-lactamase superfamily)